jgi:hypothetical protein
VTTARRSIGLLVMLGLLAAVLVALPGVARRGEAVTPVPTPVPTPVATPVGPPSPQHPVVVVGVDGLIWDDVTPDRTPALAALALHYPSGLLAGRGADEKTSSLDAWATISAGNRARAHDLPLPLLDAGSRAQDPGVAVAQRQTTPARTGARVGALADALGDRCVTGIGQRGSALGAAHADGRLTAPGSPCPVVLVSSGSAGAAELDVRQWQDRAALLIVVGIGDPGTPAHLHVAISADRIDARPSPGRLESGSTRRSSYVQAVDVAPTVLAAFGIAPPPSMIGEAWRSSDARGLDRAAYLRADERARFMPTAVVGVVIPLVAAFVLLLALAALLCWRGRRRIGWQIALWDCRIVAATPAATFVARLFPYESWASSNGLRLALLWFLVLAVDAVLLAACRARIGWLAVVTGVALGLDVLAGAPLQLHSVLGYSALVAGRFAGLGNPAFGAFAAAALGAALLAAGALGSRGVSERRSLRVAAVVGIGLVAVVVDGAPQLGSDVGGVLSLVPAFALLVWAVAGRRIRIRTVLVAAVAAVAVIVLFAALDLARAPESRTHLGRFASDLLNGRAGETLDRKAAANWALLTRNVFTLIVPPLLAVFAVVLARADRWRATAPFGRALQRQPGLRAGLGAALVAGLLGFAVNDSGVVVPAVMMLLIVPIAVEAAARHRHHSGESLAPGGEADVP